MKQIKHVFYLVLFFITIGCTETKLESDIQVGQTWIYIYQEDNPYEPTIIWQDKVIEIKGEYVLYVRDGKDTFNDSKYWFIVGHQCITNCK
jgi:hypothetical protein